MNGMRTSVGVDRGARTMAAGIGLCAAILVAAVAPDAPAQVGTNAWTLTGGGNWSTAANWTNGVPNGAGEFVFLTGNTNTGAGFTSTATINLDMDATLGYLIFGDTDRGTLSHIAENVASPTRTLTFDTGDSKMALLAHGSGDLGVNMGNGGNYINTRLLVSDPDGLYIDNFYNLYLEGGATNARALDGGGHDIVKGEDGYLIIRRIVTNVNNFVVRDGIVRLDYDNQVNVNMRSTITNVVLGVPGGAIDTGAAHPLQTTVNYKEGETQDRSQFPLFEIFGANNTNSAVQMTNTFNLVMNRGIFRTYSRQLATAAQQNGNYQPGLFTGSITLNGAAEDNWLWIEAQDNGTLTGSIKRTVFSGPIAGTGGFTKLGYGEMTLTGTNDFTGRLNIFRGHYAAPGGFYAGIALRDGGQLTGVSEIVLDRNGDLLLDNSAVNIADRVNDAAWIESRSWNAIKMDGNASAATSETLGHVTNRSGYLTFRFDRAATPQPMTLNLAGLTRSPGSVISFVSVDTAQGIFATNVNGLTVNIADASTLAQIGSGGAAGTVNRSVVAGIFAGDALEKHNANLNDMATHRADEFMTLDGTRLRTLDPLTEMANLGGRTNGILTITQASAPADANVNINFMVTNLNMGARDIITKTVQGAVTFNSIRLGLASNYVGGGQSDAGSTLLISEGGRLTSESGMLLAGRDTGSSDGAGWTAVSSWITRGILDLDGAAGNREAIVQNESGQTLFLRTTIEAGNGLTKAGDNSVVLDGPNRITGTVTVARGNLYLYHREALGAATQLVRTGRSTVFLNSGADIRGVDMVVESLDNSQSVLLAENRHGIWGGDILFRMVDETGYSAFTPTIAANNVNGVLTLLGDIGMDAAPLPTADLVSIDAPQWTTGGGAGVMNIYGHVGDYLVNGEAVTYDASLHGNTRVNYGDITNRINDENFVLRFWVDGNAVQGDEHNVNILNPWRAVGRFYAMQGVIRYLGDPAAGNGDFFTDQVLTNSNPQYSGQTGFELGGSGLDANGHAFFLLTKDGQRFNAERWSASNSGRQNNTIVLGLEHFGPTNATVTVGNTYDDGTPDGADNRITLNRDFRLYAHNGWDGAAGTASVGRVDVQMSLVGNQNASLTKIGNGVVYLQGPSNLSYDEGNDVRTNLLMGGELVLDRRSGMGFDVGLIRSRGSGSTLVLAGGDLTHWGSASGHTTENFASNMLVRAGDSTIRTRTGGATGTNTLYLATGTGATVTRWQGGTVNFERDLTAGGNAAMRIQAPASSRLGSWAVYSSNGMAGGTWAATDEGTNVVGFTGYAVGTYAPGLHSDVVVNPGFGANAQTASLRFNDGAWMGLGGNQIDVTEGGILITENASDGLGGMSSIDLGSLTASGGELILHNYNMGYGFNIGADIVGPVALTHSGPGRTLLVGNNTFEGIVYLNGGTLSIDSATRLGNTTNSLEMRGGALEMTSSLDLGYRQVTLGGDGGIFRVAAGQTVGLSGQVVSETNFYGSALLNSGHGDFIKEGPGRLILGAREDMSITNLTGTYQGLTDIREGTLEIQRWHVGTFSNGVFGSSKSFYDGTIVRGGATLAFAYTNRFPADVGNMSWTNTMPDFREWLVLEQGATLRWEDPGPGYQGMRLNGVIDIRGDTVFSNRSDEVYFNPDSGYILGGGALISAGGSKMVYNNNPEFTGRVVVESGTLAFSTPQGWGFPNASGIELGVADAATSRGDPFLSFRPDNDGTPTRIDIPQNVILQGNQNPRIGCSYVADHDDEVNFYGSVDMSTLGIYGTKRELVLYFTEQNANTRGFYNGDSLEDDFYLNFLGGITGGDKRIRTYATQGGGTTKDLGAQTPEEMNNRWIVTFAGTNTGWTGELEAGNRAGTDTSSTGPDFDKQHVVRFGLDEGLTTWAIGSNNVVVLRHDVALQAHGSHVTIGTLISDASEGGDGYYGNQIVTNTWIENGGFNPGSLTIVQATNQLFSGGIRDGTVYSRYATNSPAAALSIVKDGPATLTLAQPNTYSGTTRVMAGMLALTGSASIATSPTIQIDAGAVFNVTERDGGSMTLASGQTLKGEGMFDGGLIVASGATVAPGSSPGVLTTTGDVEFQSGSTFSVEIIGTLAGQADQLLMSGIGDTLTLGGATLLLTTPNVLPVSSAFIIIDGFSVLSGTFAGLPNSGDTVATANNTFEIQYNANDITLTVVPEPGTLGFIGLAGLLGWLARRRRS
jgi:autotransporter-associated beta strand protein